MPKYKVRYEGWFIVEADSIDEALEFDRDDYEVKYEQWENTDAEEWENDNAE